MATRVPNPIRFYYTSNESLLNKLSFNIKYVLMHTRTHLTWSDEPRALRCGVIKAVWCLFSAAILCHLTFSYTIWIGRTWRVKWRLVEVDRSKFGQVMAFYPSGCEEMYRRRKKLHLWTLLSGFEIYGYFWIIRHSKGNFMVSNNI